MKSLYYRFIYQRLMRLAHRFDWHHMQRNLHIEPGMIHGWCHWCGARYQMPDMSKRDGLRQSDGRMAGLERALRYWLPDETMIPQGHEAAWNEHVQLIPEHRRGATKAVEVWDVE